MKVRWKISDENSANIFNLGESACASVCNGQLSLDWLALEAIHQDSNFHGGAQFTHPKQTPILKPTTF